MQLVALVTQDEERADEFVARTLGEFATAEPPSCARPLRVYLREQSNAAAHARLLLSPPQHGPRPPGNAPSRLLPAPLEGRGLQVALALEIVHWRSAGEPALTPARSRS